MTNRENIIKALKDEHDDPGWTESVIAYNIACPHYGPLDGLPCGGYEYPWDELTVCGPCKMEWLDKEVSE